MRLWAEMLPSDVQNELVALTPRQRGTVLLGLSRKLQHYKTTGRLSYRYEVCPVCIEMGSTEGNPQCDSCYIKISCKKPFVDGFRDDPLKGYEYFSAMEDFLKP